MQQDKLLTIQDLHVHFQTREGTVRALNGVDMTLYRGETLGLVGESGCGKSMTARAILRMVPYPGRIVKGDIHLYRKTDSDVEDIDLTALHEDGEEIRHIRGRDISMIFQEPMTSLSPVHTIGNQIIEAIRLHQGLNAQEARARAVEMLDLVGIPDANARVDAYPFELSGGMRQRAMIAMALSCNPSLLIADEPTTALDVTIQAQILELIVRLQEQFQMTVLMITHNLGVVAAMAHRVAVMYLGRIVEQASVDDIFHDPKHPYTQALLKSVPKVGEKTGQRLWAIEGNVPDPFVQIPGCPFHPRCHQFMPGVCDRQVPQPTTVGPDHMVSCLLYSQNVESAASTPTAAEGEAGR